MEIAPGAARIPVAAAIFLAAAFFTPSPAVLADAAWSAEWIWGPGEESAVNVRRFFRGSFALNSVPKNLRAMIAASGPYVLWVNGNFAGRGPERSFPRETAFDERDIGSFVRSGMNCVAVLSEHAGVPTFSSIVTRPGLLVQLEWEDGNASRAFGTSCSWRSLPAKAWSTDSIRISPMRGFLEIFDSRLLPDGWNAPGFDDSRWEGAVSLGKPPVSPWTGLRKRLSPFPEDEEVPWKTVLRKGSVREHGVLAEIPVPGSAAPFVSASFSSTKWEGFSMETRSLYSVSCYLDGRMLAEGESRSPRHYSWRIDAPPGDHVLFVGLTGPPPGGSAAFHLSAAEPLKRAEWKVCGRPAKAVFVGYDDVARYNGAENDSFEESSSAVSVSRSRRIAMRPAGKGRAPSVVLDFGKEVSGRPFLRIEAPEGAVADLCYAEVLDEGMPNPYRGGVRHADRYVCREGVQTWEVGGKRAMRFMRITMRNSKSEASIISAGVREERMPYARIGAFESSDPELDLIWETCRRTLDLCTEDVFIDCPWRERALWVSDFKVEALSHYVATGDASMPARCLSLLAGGMASDGLLNGVAPTEMEARLEEGGLLWILALGDYFRMTGDLKVFRELEGSVRKALRWYEQRRSRRGLLEYKPRWLHVDWEDAARGGEIGRYSGGPSAALNALYAGALSSAAGLYAAAGREKESEALFGQAAQTAGGLNSFLWSEEKGVFADELVPGRGLSGGVSQQANVLCMLYARPGPERARRILKYILDERNEMAFVGTPYFMHYFFSAMVSAGLGNAALSMLKRQWGWMLRQGATCFWECFNTNPGRSACHGWSAHPLYFLASEVLGVKPAGPGYSRILLEDFGAGPERAAGRVAVPGGAVEAGWSRGSGRVELRACVPAGREAAAAFRLRDSESYSLFMDGKRVWVTGDDPPPGVRIEGGRLEADLGPGGKGRILLVQNGEGDK